MSYDRILPKPLGFYNDGPAGALSISRSTVRGRRSPDRWTSENVGRRASPPSLHLQTNSSRRTTLRGGILNSERDSDKVPFESEVGEQPTVSIPNLNLVRDERALSAGSSKSTSSRDSSVQFCLCQPEPKIPRPRNAFILFRQHFQAAVVAQNPGLANPEISKIIGQKWKYLPAESKQDWNNLALEEKARHQQQYPDYRYQPRRNGRKSVSAAASRSGINNNPTGASTCSRCGGRVMNPPPTPSAPFVLSLQTQDDSGLSKQPTQYLHSPADDHQHIKKTRSLSPVHATDNEGWGATFHPQYRDDSGLLSPYAKRRRCTLLPAQRDLSPVELVSPRTVSLSQPAQLRPRASFTANTPQSYGIGSFSGSFPDPALDPSLTLPPLQTLPALVSENQAEVESRGMNIPFINKVKLLSKVSPPFTTTKAGQGTRGAVIAVEGRDSSSVQDVLQYLKHLLSIREGYIVRIFERRDTQQASPTAKSNDPGDPTGQCLESIPDWRKISDDIVKFLNESSESPISQTESERNDTRPSPKLRIPLSTGAGMPQIDAVPSLDSTFRIALVPQYQLSTVDAHACAIPINDAYAPIDHWQWIASLWRGCVGPDITVYVQDCDKEDMGKFGDGNPVELRLDDARAIIVGRSKHSSSPIEERALRRIGFEVQEFLRR